MPYQYIDLFWKTDKILFAAVVLSLSLLLVCAYLKGLAAERRERELKGGKDRFERLSPEEIPRLLALAGNSRNKWKRIRALAALGFLRPPAAVAVLEEGLSSPDEDIVYFTLLALGQFRNAESASVILSFLERSATGGQRIVSLLEGFPPEIVPRIIVTAKSQRPAARFWALKLLSKFRPAEARETALCLAADESADVRAAAVECLGEIGGSAALTALRSRRRGLLCPHACNPRAV